MTIRYLFHSGMAIEGEGFTVVIDYYLDTCEGERGIENGVVDERYLGRPGRFYVLSSHGHGDHFNPVVMAWQQHRPDIQYILSEDILMQHKAHRADNVHPINSGERYEDDVIAIDAFGSTDLGVSFALTLGGKTIFHAGDLNNWHWNLEAGPDFVQAAERAYLAELAPIAERYQRFDAAMFPVDPRLGPDSGRGAEQFMQAVDVGALIPIHFSTDDSEPARYQRLHPSQNVVVLSSRGQTHAL
jgi:L-ascorbate metabolism protein UlaG (beta-lactamase superfamily)